jgi:predicted dehydrogenase
MSESNGPLRVGLIGVGWGAVVQTPAFRMVPEFEVAALCSRRPERVQAAGEKLGIQDVSTDWRAFVERDDLDIISICTPVDLHYEQTLAAIAAGKHVLVEKPVGLNSLQTGEMLAAAEAAGVCHAVCFESRWEPPRYAVRELIRSGHLGTPYFVTTRSGADYWHPTRGLQSEWMYRTAEGGGYLMGMGSHDIEYICSMFGDPVAVCADVRSNVPERLRADGTTLAVDADDTSVLLVRMANGALATILTTAIAFQQNFRSFDAFGSDGSVSIGGALMGESEPEIRQGTVGTDGLHTVEPVVRMPRSGMEPPKRRAGPSIQALALMLEDWLPAFSGGESGAPSLRDGHRVARIIDAARESAAGAGWVPMVSA